MGQRLFCLLFRVILIHDPDSDPRDPALYKHMVRSIKAGVGDAVHGCQAAEGLLQKYFAGIFIHIYGKCDPARLPTYTDRDS